MKKLLSFLGAAALIGTSSASVVSCGNTPEDKIISVDFTSKVKMVESAKTIYNTFKGDNAPEGNKKLIVNFNLPGAVKGSVDFTKEQYNQIFTNQDNAEILKEMNAAPKIVNDNDDFKEAEKSIQKAFNNYYVTEEFQDKLADEATAIGNSSAEVDYFKDIAPNGTVDTDKETKFFSLVDEIKEFMIGATGTSIPDNTLIYNVDIDESLIVGGWGIKLYLVMDSDGDNKLTSADSDGLKSNQITLDTKKLKKGATQDEVDAANVKEKDGGWFTKAQNSITLGVYKIQLFLEQVVLDNGTEWLKDVVAGLIEGFADQTLELVPGVDVVLRIPGAQWLLNKMLIHPLANVLATPITNAIVTWASNNQNDDINENTLAYMNNTWKSMAL